MKRILVGISGGIDSAVTAYRLKQKGYDVIGAHLQITPEPIVAKEKLKRLQDALDIPIELINGEGLFKSIVLENFRKDHLAGKTPSPCVICNPELKWKLLFDKADEVNADGIASGHYIQKEKINGIWYLKKGVDQLKDQSYFLWRLTQQQLSRMVTPLGGINKSEVKEFAREIGLEFLAEQKESTGLCFSQGLSYPELLRKYIPEAKQIPAGDIVNSSGKVVGVHKGYLFYTIGQKRGFELFNDSLKGSCIVNIDSEKNILVLGQDDSLWQKDFVVSNTFFSNWNKAVSSKTLEVVVRGIGRNPKGYGKIVQLSDAEYKVELEDKAWAMAPGQPVVFYENSFLLGGGFMK